MSTLFVADIHLGNEHPEISHRFNAFLRQACPGVEALYILGDLFETWIGDDGAQPEHLDTINTLRELTKAGLPIFVMHGNRDFLLRERFERDTGCQLIDDPVVIDLYGTPTLLMHGDTLCTDDVDYIAFRNYIRNPSFTEDFLSKPVPERQAIVKDIRQQTRLKVQEKPAEIMDTNQGAIIETMKAHNVTHMIHGHTHRPATHTFELDGTPAQRIVLGDWYTQDSWLICDANGCVLHGQ